MQNYRRNSGLQQSGLNFEGVLFLKWSYCKILLHYNVTINIDNKLKGLLKPYMMSPPQVPSRDVYVPDYTGLDC